MRDDASRSVQPYLMGLMPGKAVTKLFLVADGQLIELATPSVLQGLDILFKSFSVFNARYPLGWKVFWEMVENGLFKLDAVKLTNSANELLRSYEI